ncbi:hypothetical protein [Flagellatimonas centrodinii]|nr:hypothetical protein [Flagellatimonas centrodinii]
MSDAVFMGACILLGLFSLGSDIKAAARTIADALKLTRGTNRGN